MGEMSRKVSADERRSPPMRWLGETSTSSTMTLSFVSRLPRIGRGTKVVRYRTVGAAVGRVKPHHVRGWACCSATRGGRLGRAVEGSHTTSAPAGVACGRKVGDRSEEATMAYKSLRLAIVTTAWVVVAAGCSSDGTTPTQATSGPGSAPSFDLKIGDIVSLTGDLGTYGPPIENGAQAGVKVITEALTEAGVSGVTVEIVATEDDQTDAKAGVEAATKLVQSDDVDMVMGPLASTVTEAVAQSVTIPQQVVTITPSGSASNITDLEDEGFVYRTAPADSAQAHFLVDLMGKEFGEDATVNVGVRNDAYGTGLQADFSEAWTAAGGTIGQTVEWNPDAPTFDTEAQTLVEGSPDAWLIVDFPETFAKVGPALVRTGSWDPAKTFVTDGLRDASLPESAGDEATEGLLGTSPTTASNPAA
jgi:ABC-type branched-subunit amino acid transport system substrate-binding protein